MSLQDLFGNFSGDDDDDDGDFQEESSSSEGNESSSSEGNEAEEPSKKKQRLLEENNHDHDHDHHHHDHHPHHHSGEEEEEEEKKKRNPEEEDSFPSDEDSDSSSEDSLDLEEVRLRELSAEQAQEIHARLSEPTHLTGYVYDKRMAQHENPGPHHPECPDRIKRIHDYMYQCGLLDKCVRCESRSATKEEILLVHTEEHYDKMMETQSMDDIQLGELATSYNSIYLNKHSVDAALISCGSLLSLTEKVVSGDLANGFAIIRPPGHHAEQDCAMGFCLFNNVAIAAKMAQTRFKVNRVLIVDWDVHHGNGIHAAFESDPSILYCSIHRHDGGNFYPFNAYLGSAESVGKNGAEGRCVNIPWPHGGMNDSDYIYAFERVIMPIAREFNPELVLISAGFDAAQGDPLGGCEVTGKGYAHMTYMLKSLAGGKVVVALEGGYNLASISISSAAVTGTLLGLGPPPLSSSVPSETAVKVMNRVCQIQSNYWKSIHPTFERPTADLKVTPAFYPLINIVNAYLASELGKLGLQGDYDNQIFSTPDFLSPNVDLLVIFHDSGSLHFVNTEGSNRAKLGDIYLGSPIIDYAQAARANGYEILLVSTKIEGSLNNDIPSFVWSKYLQKSKAARTFILTSSKRAKMRHLLGCCGETAPSKFSGFVVISDGSPTSLRLNDVSGLDRWISEFSQVYVAHRSPFRTPIHTLDPDYGNVFSSGAMNEDEVLTALTEDIFRFFADCKAKEFVPSPIVQPVVPPLLELLEGTGEEE